ATHRILRLPTVASKSFLITIGDRTITGMVARDQFVGPWQVPVADVAVTATSLGVSTGEAMAMGERPPIALISAAASARMAVGECLTNMAAANIPTLGQIRMSANWMAAPDHEGEGARLYEAVQAIGLELCPSLGISIPVGKDSMSMKMKWNQENGEQVQVTAPLALNITGFGPVSDVHKTLTPQLRTDLEGVETKLVLIDLAQGKQRLGGSALAQVFKQLGNEAPDVESANLIKSFFKAIQAVREQKQDVVLAYHDRSDGGLMATLLEMAFAGHVGLKVDLSNVTDDVVAGLFNEELGAVIQVPTAELETLRAVFGAAGFPQESLVELGTVNAKGDDSIVVTHKGATVFEGDRVTLQRIWNETSFHIQSIRDNSDCAQQEFDGLLDAQDPGLSYKLTFSPAQQILDQALLATRPKVAILREQGVNGQIEMAYAFHAAGFQAVDVHMSDILNGQVTLKDFKGIAACGGFSYGDVLGAGSGWAKSILLHEHTRNEFYDFLTVRQDTFALGVCNGCQFLSQMREVIPGAEHWPYFKRNQSEQFEARFSMVELVDNSESKETQGTVPSIFFDGMRGSQFPIAVAHGEGRAEFVSQADQDALIKAGLVAVAYVDNYGQRTEQYPLNPNGSPLGITGVQTPNGRVLALMPHPERVVMREANSWYPEQEGRQWGLYGPWLRMFQNARKWVN
ncbi:hypothetical protein BGZ73_004453, partial [Actinomortierella ambigua]